MDRAAWILPGSVGGMVVPELEGGPDELVRLANARMPFGPHSGELLLDLPDDYVFWFANRVRATGESRDVATKLAVIYSIRFNGMEGMVRPLVDGFETGESGAVGVDGASLDSDELDPEWILSMMGVESETESD